jgi:hypothetical protein
MKYNLNEINGVEIIDFLNKVDVENENEFGDTNLSRPLIFTKQEISEGRLKIYFDCYYNNWGTDQLIEENSIYVNKDKIWVGLSEPLDGDGTDEIIENLVIDFVANHKFKNQEELKYEFRDLMSDILTYTCDIQYGEIKRMDTLLEMVTKAKSLMK